MHRALIVSGSILGLGLLTWYFPLFRVMPAGHAQTKQQQEAFDAAEFVRTFWDGPLLSSLDQAVPAEAVLRAIQDNPTVAREQFGRTVGLSRSYYFFLRGTGTVVSVEPTGVGLTLRSHNATAEAAEPDVVLSTGLLFGNAVRDATGLLQPADFPNSQQYNAISAEMNRIVEAEVLPRLSQRAAIGKRMHFVGCAEVTEPSRDPRPLQVVPVNVEIE